MYAEIRLQVQVRQAVEGWNHSIYVVAAPGHVGGAPGAPRKSRSSRRTLYYPTRTRAGTRVKNRAVERCAGRTKGRAVKYTSAWVIDGVLHVLVPHVSPKGKRGVGSAAGRLRRSTNTYSAPSSAAPGFSRLKMTRATMNTFNNN